MARVSKFFRNAGLLRGIQSLVILVFLGLSLRHDLRTGLWPVTFSLVLATVSVTYALRHVLAGNPSRTQQVMNVCAGTIILAGILRPRIAVGMSLVEHLAWIGVIAFYMGCYFWFMSDERVIIE